jgi:UTP--glucose-1-phosphate uridylyltransferase
VTRPCKVIFPLAGPGPRARANSMRGRVEMMPIVDKPMIEYATEEALAAGFTEFIFVTGPSFRAGAMERIGELDAALELRGRTELLDTMRTIVPASVNCVLIRQPQPLGAAHAVLCARPLVAGEAFAVVLADQLVAGDTRTLKDMADRYESYRCSIVGARPIGRDEPAPFGVLRCAAQLDALFQIAHVAESVRPADACTPLAPIGRSIFTPAIMTHLDAACAGGTRAARMIDAVAELLRHETVLAWATEGAHYDCGSKLGYLKATLAFGLAHPEVGDALARHLATLAKGTPPCAELSALSHTAT